jgi:mono/diheme cytochrome c family protein
MSKPFLILCAGMLMVFAAAPAIGRPPQAGAGKGAAAEAKAAAEAQNRAKKIYAVDCALCHGDNGNGQTDLAKSMELKLLDWTDPKALSDKSDQDLFDVIRKGKDKMPSEDPNRAKDDEIKSLVQYIRQFSKNGPAPAASSSPTN